MKSTAWQSKIKRYGIILSVIASVLAHYVQTFTLLDMQFLPAYHADVLARTAQDPVRFRVLVPFLAQWIADNLAVSVYAVYLAIGCLAISLFLVGAYVFLRRIVPDGALIGLFVLALSFNVIMLREIVIPYSFVEAGLFVWSLVWLNTLYLRWSSSSPR